MFNDLINLFSFNKQFEYYIKVIIFICESSHVKYYYYPLFWLLLISLIKRHIAVVNRSNSFLACVAQCTLERRKIPSERKMLFYSKVQWFKWLRMQHCDLQRKVLRCNWKQKANFSTSILSSCFAGKVQFSVLDDNPTTRAERLMAVD